ncbi:hypothetical protein KIN20_010981 [Parelaphostrongylus tenuis]|uniref:Uncharacterized protein n=1 Tax=Parelaphostrongylus tenuis TaxID=148309 RepID=A0AAD5QKQ5_PARTN|nr:hypothetical protein KIN20_010981 [Parelaphostrongylus tenuis]
MEALLRSRSLFQLTRQTTQPIMLNISDIDIWCIGRSITFGSLVFFVNSKKQVYALQVRARHSKRFKANLLR